MTALITGGMTYLYASEYVVIGILKQTNNYPFGDEGPAPWHYKTADLYANVTLVCGSVFLLLLVLTLVAVIKKTHEAASFSTAALYLILNNHLYSSNHWALIV